MNAGQKSRGFLTKLPAKKAGPLPIMATANGAKRLETISLDAHKCRIAQVPRANYGTEEIFIHHSIQTLCIFDTRIIRPSDIAHNKI